MAAGLSPSTTRFSWSKEATTPVLRELPPLLPSPRRPLPVLTPGDVGRGSFHCPPRGLTAAPAQAAAEPTRLASLFCVATSTSPPLSG